MPGIYGLIKNHPDTSFIQSMKGALPSIPPLAHDTPFQDEYIEASSAHLSYRQDASARSGDCIIWVEGEAYNIAQSAQKTGLRVHDLGAFLLDAYTGGKLESALNHLDGYFTAALYDIKSQKLFLITDRLGMRAQYYFHQGGALAWAGEIKQLLALPFVDKNIDQTTAPCFMELGFLLEDHTWFENIKLCHPASIYEYDLKSKALTQRYYWSWAEIKQQDIGFDEAVDTLCDLLPKAVGRRFDPNERIGISLSGGLDSRFLFAAANALYPDYEGYSYTFGRPESEDVQIAQRVASISKSWRHDILNLTDIDWFESRKEIVWRSEAMLSMLHMHGAEFLPEISKHIDITLNGYAGDVVTGGGYITKNNTDQRISTEHAKGFYRGQTHLAQLGNAFYDTPHVEPHLYMNRVRRFTNVGTINHLPYIDHRKPFMDNDLMEFMFSITDTYKKDNKLYAQALLKLYPEYFKDIPWQKTGKSIDKPMKSKLMIRIKNRVKRGLSDYGLYKDQTEYTDYAQWIRDPKIANQLLELLHYDGSQYSKVIAHDYKSLLLEPHLKHKYVSNQDKILRVAAIEYYLQRVFS